MSLKLRAFLICMFATAAAAPLAVFWLWPHSSVVEGKYEEVSERHLLIANNLATALENYHRSLVVAFESFAADIAAGGGEEAIPIFQNLNIRQICVVDATTGDIQSSYMAEMQDCPSQMPPDRMEMFTALAAQPVVTISPVEVPPGERPRMFFAKKVGDRLVVAWIHTGFFRALQRRIRFGRQGHAAIFDQTGRVLAHPSDAWSDQAKDLSDLSPVQRLKTGGKGVSTFYSPELKTDMIAGFASVAGPGWGVMVPQPVSEFAEAASRFNREALIILSVGLAFSFALAVVVSVMLSRRIEAIETQVREVEEGHEIQAPGTERGFIKLRELLSLQAGVGRMARAISKARAESHNRNEQLRRVNEMLLRQIGERKSAQTQHAASETRFRNLFESIPIPIREEDFSTIKNAVDALGIPDRATLTTYLDEHPGFLEDCRAEIKIVGANQASMDLHGYHDKQTMIADVTRELGAESQDMLRGIIETIHAGETTLSRELSIYTVTGEVRRVVCTWSVIPGHEKTYRRILVIFLDITERLKSEERLRKAQKMEAIGQLTGGIAHDFNNLLTVIGGNADLIEEDIENARTYVDPVQRAVRRGAELTGRLLAFARQQPLAPKVINLVTRVEEMSSLMERALGGHIEITIDSDPDIWPARADPGQVGDAILNLCLNARDAMPDGGKLLIECRNVVQAQNDREELDAGDYVSLSVTDTGSGIDPDVLPQVFEPFFSTKGVGKGSGLGLSMVYGFAKQSRGHAEIRSVPGTGTTVEILLPRGTATPGVRPRSSARARTPAGDGRKVLVLEDQVDVRKYLINLIRRLGYDPRSAGDAAEAEALLAAHPEIGVAVCDIMLPGGVSGLDFASRSMAQNPDLKIIFISGNPPDLRKDPRPEIQGCVVLTKPFDMKRMGELLYQYTVKNAPAAARKTSRDAVS